jgi:DNA helicase MCM8
LLKKLFKSIGKLVTVRGTVVRISSVKSLITQIDFLCTQCGNRQVKHLDEGRYSVPGKCATAGCKSKAFVADRESSKTVSIDMQRIRLQEKLATTGDAGRVPRTVDIECIGYMVDRVIPGDVISITGIVKYSQISEGIFVFSEFFVICTNHKRKGQV